MIEANELNSAFYAMRLLLHRLGPSEIEAVTGTDYPATEFTKQEQLRALDILHSIEDLEKSSVREMSQQKIRAHLVGLSDQIEALANKDLLAAGYELNSPGTLNPHVDEMHCDRFTLTNNQK